MPTDYEAIAREHREYYGKGDRHLRIYRRLYDDDTHFVYELVQNADDSESKSLSFVLRDGELLVVNDGRQFNNGKKDDVRDICSIGLSEKDLTQIGSFGIGFKAVYAYSSAPKVYSGDERFEIRRLVEPAGITVHPDIQKEVETGKTAFCLPFKRDLRPDKIEHLASRLSNLHPWTLLFLRHLKAIDWRDERTGKRGSYRSDFRPREKNQDVGRLSLTKQVSDGETVSETFLVFRNLDDTLKPPPHIIEELASQAEDEYELRRVQDSANLVQPIEIAFRLDNDRLAPVDGGVLFSYLPTAQKTQLHFLIQARYQTTPARDNLPKDNNWNRWLIEATASFLPEVMQTLRKTDLMQPEFFDVLPVDDDNVPEFLVPIVETLSRALKDGEFILTDDGQYACPQQVFSPHSQELRELVSAEQLAVLTRVAGAKWLHRDIRQGRRLKVVQAAGVKEFNLESLAACITKEFIKNQPDDWLSRFYAFLKGRESLWQHGQYGRPDGVLRNKPIIKREDGEVVCPFEGDEPNAYLPPDGDTAFPIVKKLLTSDPEALDFLKRLGLSQPAIEDEVVKFILPKYSKGNQPDVTEHTRDMAKIVEALKTDSKKARERVEAKLKKTACFRAVNAVSGEADYKCAEELYLPTPEIRRYFAGNAGAWLLDELQHGLSAEELFRLMKGLEVEDKPRKQPFDPKFDAATLRAIRNGAAVTRGTVAKIVDYSLDGLDLFLDDLFRLPSDKVSDSAQVLWDFLLAYAPASLSACEKVPSCFQGAYTYQRYGDHTRNFDAQFLNELREKPWLPDQNGSLHKPSVISITDLPDAFRRSEVLGSALKMIRPEATALAQKLGIEPSTIELLQDPEKVEQFKKWAAQQGHAAELTGSKGEGNGPKGDDGGGTPSGGGHRATSGGGGGHTNGGAGGEGALHERLKDWITANPERLESGLRLHRRECGLESGYRPDLILQDAEGKFATVEVEAAFPSGNDTGMWQAVAYKHVFAAERGVPCDQVRGFLVAPRIPESIKANCRRYGVEAFEVGDVA